MSTTDEDVGDVHLQTEHLMQRLLRTGELSDFRFIVREGQQSETFRCHKVLLCRAGKAFETMFLGDMQEKEEVTVTDVSPQAFKVILKHIYTDEEQLDNLEMCLNVIKAAHKYFVVSLVEKCVKFAIEKLQTSNVCKLLEVAILTENQQLKEACVRILQENTEEVIGASCWVEAHRDCVRTLVQQDTLNVSSELPLVTACERWVQHQVTADDTLTAREVRAPILPYLRLRTLTAEQLGAVSQDDSIFTAEEIRQILRCIVKPEQNKLPEDFCQLTNSRFMPNHIDKMNIDAVISYMNDKDTDELVFTKSSTQNTIDFSPLVLRAVRCHVLVYGVHYFAATSDSIDILDKISSQKKYQENMTVQLIERQTRACVASVHFEDKVDFDGHWKDLYFTKPYLMKEGTPLLLKVTYHTRVNGQRSLYMGNTDFSESTDDEPGLYSEKNTGALGIWLVRYKIVK